MQTIMAEKIKQNNIFGSNKVGSPTITRPQSKGFLTWCITGIASVFKTLIKFSQ